ncbi:MAG: SGNH/GDSL hydrolase family protein [Planctomycetes bacterium]|nr:SGNH/GDSL hydrolase family protein [Planctomycetota bacterium]
MASRSAWMRRALLVVVGLALAELGLRVVGFGVKLATGRDGGVERSPGAPAYLCIGDSCVWGPNFDPQRSYPARLEALLESRPASSHAPRPIVLNYGSPGRPSWEVPGELERLLEARRFEAVLVTVGANNVWRDPRAELRGAWADRIRLWKLARLAAARMRGKPEVDRPADAVARAEHALDEARLLPQLREDLRASSELAREHSVPLFVVCYAADESSYGLANRCLRQAASELAIGVIDPAPAARELAARVGHERVFFLDLHPRPVGYEIVARSAYEGLRAAGVHRGAPLGDLLDGLEAEVAARPLIELSADPGTAATLVLRDGPPRARCVLLAWEAQDWSGAAHPLPAQAELAGLLGGKQITGALPRGAHAFAFDERGEARIALSELMPGDAPPSGYAFEATYVALRDGPAGEELVPNSIAPPRRFAVP